MCNNLLRFLYMQILIIIFSLDKFSFVKYYSNIIFINRCVRIIISLNSWLPTTDKFVFLDFHRVMSSVIE